MPHIKWFLFAFWVLLILAIASSYTCVVAALFGNKYLAIVCLIILVIVVILDIITTLIWFKKEDL